MNNNWVLQRSDSEEDRVVFVDPQSNEAAIGDEIEAETTGQWGVVVGVIRSGRGHAECYKVWCDALKCFDYIQARSVTMREPCDYAGWSLERIGYRWIDGRDEDDNGYYYNNKTGDVIFW